MIEDVITMLNNNGYGLKDFYGIKAYLGTTARSPSINNFTFFYLNNCSILINSELTINIEGTYIANSPFYLTNQAQNLNYVSICVDSNLESATPSWTYPQYGVFVLTIVNIRFTYNNQVNQIVLFVSIYCK